MISSAMPSQRYSWSFAGLMSENGSTAIPMVVSGFATVASGFTVPVCAGAATSSPALRNPSMRRSTYSGPHHFSMSLRTVAARFGRTSSNSRRAFSAASRCPSCPQAAAVATCVPQWPGRLTLSANWSALRSSPRRYAL